jgi:hypothetical protein
VCSIDIDVYPISKEIRITRNNTAELHCLPPVVYHDQWYLAVSTAHCNQEQTAHKHPHRMNTHYTLRREKTKCHILKKTGPAVAQAVSHWLPTAAARGRVRAACRVCGGQSGTGAGFIRVLQFPLQIIIPPNSPSS